MDEEGAKEAAGEEGLPAWVMTFADLMSLLMCFFVLLLSFSEMDVQKYKQLAGSVKNAFGVQREVRAHEIPKGTSVVAKEFSPGRPEPTVLNEVRQKTSDSNKKRLAQSQASLAMTESDARQLAAAMEQEIKEGKIEIETEGNKIVVRILEKGSFPSGSEELAEAFQPVLVKLRKAMVKIRGNVKVSGHTDDKPISTKRFSSNWDLSAARALSVLHALTEDDAMDRGRFELVGKADTKPRVPNNSHANRAKNRRVEITIIQEDRLFPQDE